MNQRDEAIPAQRLPITVVTGFLGAGKTTLLNAILERPETGQAAVLVNELGDVGLDNHLVASADESVTVLDGGCLCCSIQTDLVQTVRDLFRQRVRGEVPAFERLFIETTGLADPVPMLHSLMTDALVGDRFQLAGVVTVIDAPGGESNLNSYDEALRQIAVADRIVLTKTELSDPATVGSLHARVQALNPGAETYEAIDGDMEPAVFTRLGLFDGSQDAPDLRRWLGDAAYDSDGGAVSAAASDDHDHDHAHDHRHHHDPGVHAFLVTAEAPLQWRAFADWMERLTAQYAQNILRVKGVLNIAEADGPVVIHGVQHVFHPPAELSAWPDSDHRTRLVFITRDLAESVVRDDFDTHLVRAAA